MNNFILLTIFDIKKFFHNYKSLIGIVGQSIFGAFLLVVFLPFAIRYMEANKTIEKTVIALKTQGDSREFESYLSKFGILLIKTDNILQEMQKGKAIVGLSYEKTKEATNFKVFFDEKSIFSQATQGSLLQAISQYQIKFLEESLCLKLANECEQVKFNISSENVFQNKNFNSLGFAGAVFPISILIAIMAASQLMAIDSFNGDIERKSFNLILLLPVTKFLIINSKILSTFFVSMVAFISIYLSMILCMYLNNFFNQITFNNVSSPQALLAPLLNISPSILVLVFIIGVFWSMVASLIFTLVAISSDSVKTGNMIGYFFQILILTFSGVAQLTNFQFWEFIPVLNFANAFLLGFQNTLTLNNFLLLTINVVVLLGILYFYTLKVFLKPRL